MAFIYNVTERKNTIPNAKMPRVAVATSRMMGVVTLHQIAKSISVRSTVHRADVNAVLTVLPEVVMEYLSHGLSVRLGELGSFALRFRSKAAASVKDFTSDNVKKVHIRYTPSTLMLASMTEVPVRSFASLVAERKEQEEPTDPSGETGGKETGGSEIN